MFPFRRAFAGAVVLCSVFLSGCGAYHQAQDAVEGKLSNGLTVTQVTTAAARLGQAVGSSMQTITPGCDSTMSSFNCTQAVSSTVSCAGGGTVAVVGSASGTWVPHESGNGTLLAMVAPTACSVPATGLVLGSSGNLALSGNLTVFQLVPSNVHGTLTGTVTFGPTPSVSCAVNLTVSDIYPALGQGGSCQVVGTICETPVGATCQ